MCGIHVSGPPAPPRPGPRDAKIAFWKSILSFNTAWGMSGPVRTKRTEQNNTDSAGCIHATHENESMRVTAQLRTQWRTLSPGASPATAYRTQCEVVNVRRSNSLAQRNSQRVAGTILGFRSCSWLRSPSPWSSCILFAFWHAFWLLR